MSVQGCKIWVHGCCSRRGRRCTHQWRGLWWLTNVARGCRCTHGLSNLRRLLLHKGCALRICQVFSDECADQRFSRECGWGWHCSWLVCLFVIAPPPSHPCHDCKHSDDHANTQANQQPPRYAAARCLRWQARVQQRGRRGLRIDVSQACAKLRTPIPAEGPQNIAHCFFTARHAPGRFLRGVPCRTQHNARISVSA